MNLTTTQSNNDVASFFKTFPKKLVLPFVTRLFPNLPSLRLTHSLKILGAGFPICRLKADISLMIFGRSLSTFIHEKWQIQLTFGWPSDPSVVPSKRTSRSSSRHRFSRRWKLHSSWVSDCLGIDAKEPLTRKEYRNRRIFDDAEPRKDVIFKCVDASGVNALCKWDGTKYHGLRVDDEEEFMTMDEVLTLPDSIIRPSNIVSFYQGLHLYPDVYLMCPAYEGKPHRQPITLQFDWRGLLNEVFGRILLINHETKKLLQVFSRPSLLAVASYTNCWPNFRKLLRMPNKWKMENITPLSLDERCSLRASRQRRRRM